MIVLSTVLRIKRTLDGAEIDKISSDVEAGNASAAEHRRRAQWRQRELSANSFETEYGHARDAAHPDLGARLPST